MGAWGTGIFQDDTACDVREEYKDHLGNGLAGPEATACILKSYAGTLADPDASGVVWLALAASQWKFGRLEEQTRARALTVIDSGSDLQRWRVGTKDSAARKAALEKLRAQITSPQPPQKRVAKRALCECVWQTGELISFKLLSGRFTLFRVIGHHTDRGGTYPVFELLNWIGDERPAEGELKSSEVLRSRPDHKHTITQVMIVGLGKKAYSSLRFESIGARSKPSQKERGSSVVHWKYLDKFLKEWFHLE